MKVFLSNLRRPAGVGSIGRPMRTGRAGASSKKPAIFKRLRRRDSTAGVAARSPAGGKTQRMRNHARFDASPIGALGMLARPAVPLSAGNAAANFAQRVHAGDVERRLNCGSASGKRKSGQSAAGAVCEQQL